MATLQTYFNLLQIHNILEPLLDLNKKLINSKYSLNTVQKEDNDYKFILGSIKTSSFTPEIHHMFRINLKEKKEVDQIQDRRLFLHGVKSNKVENIISSGYSDQLWTFNDKCKEDCIYCVKPLCARYTSESFSLESFKSIGNRKTAKDQKYVNKQLVYLFVVADKEMSSKIITKKTDSRGCYIEDGSFRKHHFSAKCISKPSTETIPAYLLVLRNKL